jgi:hypothetical protein
MIRWKDSEPERLHPQEQALLALCDRLTVLERAFTAETDALRKVTLEQARRLAAQHEQLTAALALVAKQDARLSRLEREHRSLMQILEREG